MGIPIGYLYLTLSILFTTAYALCYKVASVRDCEVRAVNMCFYLGAVLVSLLGFLAAGCPYHPEAARLGLLTGVGVFFSTLTFFYHMRKGLLAISWTVIGLAVLLPVTASVLIWREQPSLRQWVGVVLLVAAFVLFGTGSGKRAK